MPAPPTSSSATTNRSSSACRARSSEVIIGNPSIADVTVQGGNLLVVTGKTFGVTNIIALDAQRNVIQDQRVVVERKTGTPSSSIRGRCAQSYTCSPTCMPDHSHRRRPGILRPHQQVGADEDRDVGTGPRRTVNQE